MYKRQIIGKILSRPNFEPSAYGEFWALSSLSYYLLVPITALTLVATKQIADWHVDKKNSDIKHYINNLNNKIVWTTLFLTFLSIVFTPVLKSFLHIDSSLSIIILNISIISTLLYSCLLYTSYPIYPINKHSFIDLTNFCYTKKIARTHKYPEDIDPKYDVANDYRYFNKIINFSVLEEVYGIKDGRTYYKTIEKLHYEQHKTK